MNVLAMGLPFWGGRDGLARYQSAAGHEVRTLGLSGDVDYTFTADETAVAVITRIAQEWRPDLLLCMCPEMYPPPLAVEDCPIRTAAMISDWNLYQPQLEHNLARFDGVLSDWLGSQTLAVWGQRPRYWGPVYAHRPLIHRDLGLARDLDIVFLGNLNHAIHRRRGQMLERVAALAGRYRVLISGEHAPEEYAALMNRARIVVNHTLRGEMNLRCFEAPACGALLLVEAENLEVAEWLQPDAEVVLYTLENIEARLVHFLEHEDERARIAAAGQARIAALAPECRMDDLFAWIAAQPAAPRAFPSLDIETQALAGLLWMGSSMVPEQRAWAQTEGARLPERFPGSAVALLAAAGLALDAAAASTDRAAHLKRALAALHAACELRPDLIVAWLNLASVARQLHASTLERTCLERALQAESAAFGGYLYGSIHEPFFAAWRRALGDGTVRRAMLQAGAATQLGTWHRAHGAPARGLELAEQALEWWPAFTPAILLAGECFSALGDWEAAIERYARALPLCPFDADVRRALVTALRQAGRADEAQALALESAALFGAGAMWQDAAAEFSALARA